VIFAYTDSCTHAMATKKIVQQTQGAVKPLLSLNDTEARHRVIKLYRALWRQISYIKHEYLVEIDVKEMREELRRRFYSNSNINDIRVIDMLVIKGQMELNETVMKWKQECHLMNYFKKTHNPKPRDFISKFLAGKDSE